MSTMTERLADEKRIRDAENVLSDLEVLISAKHLTRDCAVTAGKVRRHLEAAKKLLARGLSWRTDLQYGWHVGQLENLCHQYWRQRGRPA